MVLFLFFWLTRTRAAPHFPDKPFYSEFVDLVRFDSQGKIAQKREYWDTGHIHSHVDEHRTNKKDAQ